MIIDMNSEDLRKLQLTQLEILKEVKRICDINNIKYFLTDGTLLGAVRHQGFIPWDDDLDIAMLRPEYEKFLEVANTQLDGKYFIQNWETDSGYPFPYTKILKNNTICSEIITRDANVHEGIFIDIFPIDKCGTSNEMKKKLSSYLFWNKLLLMKCNYRVWEANGAKNRKLLYIPFIILSKLFTKKYITNQITHIINIWNNVYTNSSYCFENTGYNFLKWIISIDNISDLTEIIFEDDKFMCPLGYSNYLKELYGNYMQLPPISERENRHSIINIKF